MGIPRESASAQIGIIWANEAGLQLWRAEDVASLSVRDLSAISDIARARLHNYAERLGAGETITSDWTLYPENTATTLKCQFSGVPVSGDRIAMLCRASDMSEPVEAPRSTPGSMEERSQDYDRLAEAEARLLGFAESGSDWFWETNASHEFIYFSENIVVATGYSAKNMLGQNSIEIVTNPQGDEQGAKEYLDAAAAHIPFRDIRFQFTRPDQSRGWISISGQPNFDPYGAFKGFRGVGSEITEQQKMQSDLLDAKDQAESANAAKSKFLSSMSHELRTPLNGILGFAQLLQLDFDPVVSPDQVEGVEQILRNGQHLLRLINEVLELSQIEEGQLSMEIDTVDASEIVQDCLALIRNLAQQRDLSVHFTVAPNAPCRSVEADPVRLKQVLINLMMNAVKYNSTGTQVGLRWEPGESGFTRFSVWDDGPGIPKDKYKDLFQPFNRLGMDAKEIEGTGIGLAISKTLVELMGGHIGFHAGTQTGAVFWFELPMASETALPKTIASNSIPTAPANDAVETEDQARRFKVLYVEDNPANMLMMEKITARLKNINLLQAHTAELGIARARAENPDLILMDINLPGMNGIEALKAIRSLAETAQTPIFAISAAAMPNDIERATNAGFDDYITKPVNVPQLMKKITDALQPDQI
jgi:PAS domain S-box-containing protein